MNPILIIILPLFNQLRDFLGPTQGLHTALDFRDNFLASFDQCESELKKLGLEKQKIENIKYALTAFADECVMNSAWPGKISWMKRSLQLQFFGEHSAGEGFFERLNQIRQSGPVELDSLEIYALCLQLGFQGVYKFKDKSQLLDLITTLQTQITALRGPSEFNLSLGVNNQPLEKKSKEISLGWIGLGTTAILLFILLGYNLATHLQLRHAIKILTPELTYDL